MHYPHLPNGDYYSWQTKHESANRLFVPENSSLNKGPDKDWSGKFKQFVPHYKFEAAEESINAVLASFATAAALPFVAVSSVLAARENFRNSHLFSIKGVYGVCTICASST